MCASISPDRRFVMPAALSSATRICGAPGATGNALRHSSDKMFCNAAATSYFTLVSLSRLVDAQYARHALARWGAWGGKQGGRMKYHGTAPACSIAPYKVTRLFCPQCQDLIIAATQSQHVSRNEIRHWWVCEACGHEFRTTVRWLPPVESEPAADEAELLRSRQEPLAAWNIQRGL